MRILAHYQLLADLFEYPSPEYPQMVQRVKKMLDESYPDAGLELKRFIELLPAGELRIMQELFIRSFDVQAVTTLDIGYVLFGDDYKRGELLSNLNREHREADNDCRNELADHLPNILRLLGKLTNQELIEEMVQEIIAPTLRQMISEFSPERIRKKNEAYKKHYRTLIESATKEQEIATLYQFVLKALYKVLEQDFSIVEQAAEGPVSDFLRSINRENEIETKANICYPETNNPNACAKGS